MTNTEIKKALYKQKPIAEFEFIRVGVAYYSTTIDNEGEDFKVSFQVPVNDMGDADYLPQMDAKLLNRYISE
jgi:hypothetical protein